MDLFEGVARPVINWWAVLGAGVAGFAVGGLWYSPLLFARAWMQEMKLTEADVRKGDMVRIMGLSLLFTVLLAYCLARLMQRWGGWEGGARVGLLVGTAIALVLAVNALYESRSLRLWAINAGHWFVTAVVMGALLGALR